MTKPVILWLADMPGWAYDSIVHGQMRALLQYEHAVWYWMLPRANDGFAFRAACAGADVIVSMYLLYLRGVPDEYRHKVALMLTGMRLFERN